MKHVEFFRFRVWDPARRSWFNSTPCTVEQGAVRYPGAERVESTREVRSLPETQEEINAMHTSHLHVGLKEDGEPI